MVDQRRLLLAFGLSLLVIVLYQEIVVRRYPQTPRPKAEDQSPRPAQEMPRAPSEPSTRTEVGAPAGDLPLVTVETDVYRIAIDRFRQRESAHSAPVQIGLSALDANDAERMSAEDRDP